MAIAQLLPAHDDPAYARGVALVLLAGVFWSIAGLVVRLIDDANEWQILFYRSVTLIAVLAAYIALRNRGAVLPAFRAAGRKAALAGFFLSIAFTCWIFAMTHTTIANALFVLSAAPFIAALLARVVLGEGVRRITLICMAVSMLGIGVMVTEGAMLGTLSGNLFALGAAAGFAAFSVSLRVGRAVDMTPAVCWAGLWAGLMAAAMIGLSARGFAISAHDFALCALLGCVQVGFGLILYTIGSRHVPAAELTLLSLTEVVLGPILVWLGVGEVPGVYTMVGGAIVLGAITAQALSGIRKRPPVGVV
jgi:drug/metabolite transporter (DMT)-like permease